MEKEHELREIWVDLGMIRYLYELDLFPPGDSPADALERVRERLRAVLGWETHEHLPPLTIHPDTMESKDEV